MPPEPAVGAVVHSVDGEAWTRLPSAPAGCQGPWTSVQAHGTLVLWASWERLVAEYGIRAVD